MNLRNRLTSAAPATALLLLASVATLATAADSPKAAPKAAVAAATMGLPQYKEPEAYSVDMLIHSAKANMVMKRFVDKGRIRSEISGGAEDMVMIELGDEKGTSLMLMPKQKKAMKQSRAAMEGMMDENMKKKMKPEEAVAAPVAGKIEDLGDDTLDGRVCKKLRMTVPDGTALGWFDKATGAPARMEGTANGETTVMEWKNYKVGPQTASLYEVPKGYEVMDMDEMMSQMKGMRGMPGMGGGGGMMGGMGQGMGQSMGGGLGSTLGGALGGPIGAMAGQYLGGKVGGMVGKKAASAVTPGK